MRNGQCLCGEVKFDIAGEIRWVGACHCRMCQRQGGGAFQTWVMFRKEDLKIHSGQINPFRSSANVIRSSCVKCSSHLFFEYVDTAEDVYVAAPALNGPDIKPQSHIWWNNRQQWLCLEDGIETKSEQCP